MCILIGWNKCRFLWCLDLISLDHCTAFGRTVSLDTGALNSPRRRRCNAEVTLATPSAFRNFSHQPRLASINIMYEFINSYIMFWVLIILSINIWVKLSNFIKLCSSKNSFIYTFSNSLFQRFFDVCNIYEYIPDRTVIILRIF